MEDKVKYRHEYKYIISDIQARIIQSNLDVIMERDAHVNERGTYIISSLYFDDYYNRCYYESENGTDPREKFRIRIYNGSLDRITLECKRKERGKTLKTSACLDESYVKNILNNESRVNFNTDNKLVQRFEREIETRCFKPAVIVEYERIPYVYKIGNVRVTFDFNLSSSAEVDKFLEGGYSKRLIMPVGFQLMEVKFDELIPDFIQKTLGLENMQQTAYSKYYLCRKYHL